MFLLTFRRCQIPITWPATAVQPSCRPARTYSSPAGVRASCVTSQAGVWAEPPPLLPSVGALGPPVGLYREGSVPQPVNLSVLPLTPSRADGLKVVHRSAPQECTCCPRRVVTGHEGLLLTTATQQETGHSDGQECCHHRGTIHKPGVEFLLLKYKI